MVAKAGLKRKVKEGEKEKEGIKEAEEEFQTAYSEVEKEVVELVSFASFAEPRRQLSWCLRGSPTFSFGSER